jgi:nucleoside-diphosphate-sugar epimerase
LSDKYYRIPILDKCDQVVIYGANGWMGRSALDFLTSDTPNIDKGRILLIGSKPGKIEINNQTFKIVDAANGFPAIREKAIFFNSAFLRRENLQRITPKEYLFRNQKIVAVAKNAIKQKKLFSFINLSSGVARDLDQETEQQTFDEYSRLKKSLEVEYSKIGIQIGVPIVNCRIFSLTGKYLNEFQNLALSSFINQALVKNHIEVTSPGTRRTYVDGTNLAGTLLSVAGTGEDANFDSGGELVSMLELAEAVAEVLSIGNLKIVKGDGEPSDYFGNYEEYNQLAVNFGRPVHGIHEQIQSTLQAFN